MKKFLPFLLLLIPALVWAQSIKRNFWTTNTAPESMAVHFGDNIEIDGDTTLGSTRLRVGEVIYGNGAGLTNLTATQAVMYITYLTNSFFYTTNMIVQSNLTVYDTLNVYEQINIFKNARIDGNLTVNNITITNGLTFLTNAWAGPSAPLNMGLQHVYYVAAANCTVTGATNAASYAANSTLLTISNSSAAPISLTIPTGCRTGDGARVYWITNAQVGKLSFEMADDMTNAVFRHFW